MATATIDRGRRRPPADPVQPAKRCYGLPSPSATHNTRCPTLNRGVSHTTIDAGSVPNRYSSRRYRSSQSGSAVTTCYRDSTWRDHLDRQLFVGSSVDTTPAPWLATHTRPVAGSMVIPAGPAGTSMVWTTWPVRESRTATLLAPVTAARTVPRRASTTMPCGRAVLRSRPPACGTWRARLRGRDAWRHVAATTPPVLDSVPSGGGLSGVMPGVAQVPVVMPVVEVVSVSRVLW